MKIFSSQVKDAIFNTIGSSVGGVDLQSRMESHPLVYLLDNRAKLPAVYLNPIDFPDFNYEEFVERVVQTYNCNIYYVMVRDGNTNPYEVARQRTEAIVQKLDQTFRLGIDVDANVWWSRTGSIRSENDCAIAMRELKQPYAVCMFPFSVVMDVALE